MSTDAVTTVLVETAGAVGRITLNAPERLNAVDPPLTDPRAAGCPSTSRS